jgi:phosphoglycolate phosphatase-like HAD superfamily hydrolase
MNDPQAELQSFKPNHKYLVAFDSDGCVFDSMELKHKECVIPNIIKHWRLQAISKYARMAAEFVNLYSKWRGINRFPALIRAFDLLSDWPEVQRRHAVVPVAQPLRDWIARESILGNTTLKAEVQRSQDPIMKQALAWSEAVNATVAELVHGLSPFPYVRESMQLLVNKADIIVCSTTPGEELRREWKEHDIDQYVRIIAGQEEGSKKEHLNLVSKGNYPETNVLMVGDAPGDMKAAHSNNLFFYPINPGQEEESWERFYKEIIPLFLKGHYTKSLEAQLIAEFDSYLPEIPPWKKIVASQAFK